MSGDGWYVRLLSNRLGERTAMGKFDTTTDDATDLGNGLGVLCIMDETGDTRTTWDAAVPESVEVARTKFNDAKTKGMVAYLIPATTTGGDSGGSADPVIIKSFDEAVETRGKVVMAPALVGG